MAREFVAFSTNIILKLSVIPSSQWCSFSAWDIIVFLNEKPYSRKIQRLPIYLLSTLAITAVVCIKPWTDTNC